MEIRAEKLDKPSFSGSIEFIKKKMLAWNVLPKYSAVPL